MLAWASLVATSAAALFGGANAAAFLPPDCIRKIPAHTRNGQLVVQPRGKDGLWLASPAGVPKRQLTHGTDGNASFSPDGRTVAFESLMHKKPFLRKIKTVDVATRRVRTVFAAEDSDHLVQAPAWSADGRWIAFLRESGDDDQFATHITLVRPNGKGMHDVWKVSNLTNIPTLAWSRNGRCVAYQWGDFSYGALAIRNARNFSEGVNLVPFNVTLPPDDAELFVPETVEFSADGRRLYVVFPVTVGGKSFDRIYTVRLAKPEPPAIAVGHGLYPVASPDGRLLAYAGPKGWMRVRKVNGTGPGKRFFRGIVWDWAAAR